MQEIPAENERLRSVSEAIAATMKGE